eukprot:c12538_g1_i1.p2 GENE.c12538_g1_i1~~c12538_g1_i1.p2  ORF type:complete len:181 (-),score=2.06 c12538_g1_i1:79-621(-)
MVSLLSGFVSVAADHQRSRNSCHTLGLHNQTVSLRCEYARGQVGGDDEKKICRSLADCTHDLYSALKGQTGLDGDLRGMSVGVDSVELQDWGEEESLVWVAVIHVNVNLQARQCNLLLELWPHGRQTMNTRGLRAIVRLERKWASTGLESWNPVVLDKICHNCARSRILCPMLDSPSQFA